MDGISPGNSVCSVISVYSLVCELLQGDDILPGLKF
jgi:hypothetical protein